jgi:O-antigen/teichoic acid export membrane protein
MEYVAVVNFMSGFVLTVLSVVVLFAGFRLNGLTSVYVFGNMLGTCVAVYYTIKILSCFPLKVDVPFWREYICKGLPFFLPAVVTMFVNKMGIILLSGICGDASVGAFGAASTLLEKFGIIQDGICTAIFPTLATVYIASREEAGHLFEKFFRYLFILGLPMAIGITILAKPIIELIYGNGYLAAVPVMQILAWWMFSQFVTSIQTWALGAIHQEKRAARIIYLYSACFLILNLFFIPFLKEIGLSIASLIANCGLFAMLFFSIRRYLKKDFLRDAIYLKTIVANAVMGFSVYLVRDMNVSVGVGLGIVVYGALLLLFKIVAADDMLQLLSVITRKQSFGQESSDVVTRSKA